MIKLNGLALRPLAQPPQFTPPPEPPVTSSPPDNSSPTQPAIRPGHRRAKSSMSYALNALPPAGPAPPLPNFDPTGLRGLGESAGPGLRPGLGRKTSHGVLAGPPVATPGIDGYGSVGRRGRSGSVVGGGPQLGQQGPAQVGSGKGKERNTDEPTTAGYRKLPSNSKEASSFFTRGVLTT